jgi:hypothetical protein
MKKVQLLAIILGICALAIAPTSADAFSLKNDYFGPLEFKFSDFSDGTLHGTSSGGYGNADLNEDGWGIFKIATIKSPAAQTLWFDGKDGEELTGIYYGIDDDFWSVAGNGSINIQSVSGHIDIYLDGTPDFNPTGGPGARTGAGAYPTVTDGSLFLSLDFVPGIKYGDGDTTNDHITYQNTLDSTTSPFTGGGAFYLDVVGGAFASLFDSDGEIVTDDSGNTYRRDMFGQFDTEAPGSFGWLVNSEDPISGAAVPEPATMLLLGSGMLGLFGVRKRRDA